MRDGNWLVLASRKRLGGDREPCVEPRVDPGRRLGPYHVGERRLARKPWWIPGVRQG